jgi:hypothetical protein
MACNTNLFDSLDDNVFANGSWNLISFNGTPGDITINYSTDNTTYNDLNTNTSNLPVPIITGSESTISNLYINPDNMLEGDYVFEYEAVAGNCSDSSNITFNVVKGANSGFGGTVDNSNANSISLCSNDTGQLFLIALLNGNDGTIELTDNTLTFSDSNYSNDVVVEVSGDPSSAGTIGNYTLDNTTISTITSTSVVDIGNMLSETGLDDPENPLYAGGNSPTILLSYTSTRTNGNPGSVNSDCSNCSETTEILFTISPPPNAGNDNSITICNLVS